MTKEELEKEKCELLGIIQGKDNVIKDLEWQLQEVAKDNDNYQAENKELEKENAELKKSIKYVNMICERKSVTNSQLTELAADSSSKLCEAKEIIKKFSEFVNNEAEYDPEHPQEHTDLWNELCEQAEQFLSEVEND